MIAPRPMRSGVEVGGVADVRAAMARAHAEGALERVRSVEMVPVHRSPGTDAQRRAHNPARRRRALRLLVRLALALVALGASAALLWVVARAVLAVIAAVTAAVAWIQSHLLVIGIVAGALIVLLLVLGSKGSRSCRGIHCGGCRG